MVKRKRLRRSKKEKKLHDAFITIAEEDVTLLSYKGQTLWNKLAKKMR